MISCCSRCALSSREGWAGVDEGTAGGGISSEVSSGASGRVERVDPRMATGVEERSSIVLDVPAVLVEVEVEDSVECDLFDAVEAVG